MEDSRYKKLIDHVILEQLGKGKTFTFTVTGNSMHPLIREGDPIQIEQCKPRDLSMGDIITFRNDDLTVTHRVLWITRKGNDIKLITKGDNEIIWDPPVSAVHIVGKVVGIGRANRTLNLETPSWRFMNRLLGFLFMLEMASILLYRFSVGRFNASNGKSPLLYRHLKCRGLLFATRIIM
jgi:signal peptidase I